MRTGGCGARWLWLSLPRAWARRRQGPAVVAAGVVCHAGGRRGGLCCRLGRGLPRRGVPAVWYAAAFLPVGLPVAHEAREAARQKDVFSEFTLMVLAAVGAFCIGEYAEAVAVIAVLYRRRGPAASRRRQRHAQHRPPARRQARACRRLAWRPIRGGEAREVKPGEVIEVKPGGRVPLDGALTDDGAAFDTSALTGESLPRNVVKGGEVLAGMIASGQYGACAGEPSLRAECLGAHPDAGARRFVAQGSG